MAKNGEARRKQRHIAIRAGTKYNGSDGLARSKPVDVLIRACNVVKGRWGEEPMKKLEVTAGGRAFALCLGDAVRSAELRQTGMAGNAAEYEIRLSFRDPDGDCSVTLQWSEPMLGVLGYWSPHAGRAHELHQWWAANTQTSSLCDGAPVISLFYKGGKNYRTVSLSEAVLKTRLSVCVNDFAERERLDFCVRLFEDDAPQKERVTVYLWIDETDRNLADCVADVARRWERFYPPRVRPGAGDACCAPLYSSWYACHQHPTQETLERELPLAAEAGFGALIVDDGWSYAGPGTGDYRYCGTYTPDKKKFPDMAGFVRRTHGRGLAAALWFPAAYVGTGDPHFDGFKDRFLCVDQNMNAGVPDVRYPEVRAFLTDAIRDAVREYGLDGIKLDFLTDLTRPAPPPGDGCDCKTTYEGVIKLLDALEKTRLTEFRQYYLGPAMAPYCNMLRVCDCAFDVISNRIGTVDLRMLRYPLAVHSDMLLWAKNETPETCAVMLQNVLFAVPQVSVLLQNLTDAQRRVIQNHLAYFNAHRELLLFGALKVFDPEANYTLVTAEDETLRVAALYAPRSFAFDGKQTDVFNATGETAVLFTAERAGTATVYDCFGQRTGDFPFAPGAVCTEVPVGGRMHLER